MPAKSLKSKKVRRILVTGAAGFVGRYVIDSLFKAGYGPQEIVAASQKPGEEATPGLESAAVDITDRKAMSEAIAAIRPTGIVHLAAIAHPSEARANARAAWRVNFEGALNLADAVITHAPEARLVFAGSAEAYGLSFEDAPLPIREEAPLQPMSVYGATKAAADIALRQMSLDGLDVMCFRAFNQTGPGQSPDYVVSAFARQIAMIEAGRQERRLSVGNLDAARDFLDVRDVARAYVLGLDCATSSIRERTLNLSSGTPQKIRDILDLLIRDAGGGIEVAVDPSKFRPNDIPVACGDNSRAKAVLGWAPRAPFEKTVKEVLDYWRNQF